MRNTIISLYQPSHLAGLIPTMQRCIERAADAIPAAAAQEHGDVEFSDLSLKLATDIIGQAAFGVDFGLTVARAVSLCRAPGVHAGRRPPRRSVSQSVCAE